MSTVSRQSASSRPGLLARHPLVSFFVMAYAFTWIVWSPWVLGEDGAGLLPVRIDPQLVGFLNATAILAGPTLAAFVMTRVTEGTPGVRRLLARLVLWRVGVRWYVVVLIGVPVIMLLGTMVYAVSLPDVAALGGVSYLPSYVLTFVLVLVLGGPLFEEPGWRGFALPRMQRSLGPLLASIVLGVLWALWHLPEFLVPSGPHRPGAAGCSGSSCSRSPRSRSPW